MSEELENVDTNENLKPEDIAAQEEQNEVEQPWYATYGFENEDHLKGGLEELMGLKSRASEIEEKERVIQEGIALLQEAEDPYAGMDEVKTLVAFGRKGVPASLANQIVSATPESLMQDPLQALIIAEAVKNPNKYKQLGHDVVEEALREKYNLGSGEYYPTALMKSDAIDAIESIQNLKKDVENVKNPYIFAKELKSQNEKTFAERQTLALGEAQTYAKTIKEVPYKFGDTSISLKVSNDEVDAVLNSQYAGYLGRAFDPTTKEGKQAIRDWISNQILTHKLQSGDLGTQIVNSISGQAQKKAIREVYNGQPKTVDRTGKVNVDSKNLTPAQRDLLERGLPLPSQQLKNV
jgi:hypothetical protein